MSISSRIVNNACSWALSLRPDFLKRPQIKDYPVWGLVAANKVKRVPDTPFTVVSSPRAPAGNADS